MVLFDELEDETQNPGREIGAAVADAVKQAGELGSAHADILVKAISDALRAVESKRIEILPAPQVGAPTVSLPAPIRKWKFTIKRDRMNLLEEIVAEAE